MARKKLIKGRWTKENIRTLKKLFGNHATAEVARALNRPVENVKKQASRLGLTKTLTYRRKVLRQKV